MENEVQDYKRYLLLSRNRDSSPEILKPLSNIHPTLEIINATSKNVPSYRDYTRPSSGYKKPRQTGKIERRSFYPKDLGIDTYGVKERLDEELRRSRLEREFTKFKLQKELHQTR